MDGGRSTRAFQADRTRPQAAREHAWRPHRAARARLPGPRTVRARRRAAPRELPPALRTVDARWGNETASRLRDDPVRDRVRSAPRAFTAHRAGSPALAR